MEVVGILSIRNGTGLEYPYPPVVFNLSQLCDRVIVGVDPEFPADAQAVKSMNLPGVDVFQSPWDMSFKGHGVEIARQMDHLVDVAKRFFKADWVVVLQADELLHEEDFPMLRSFMERSLDTNTTGMSTERIYFWKNLETVRTDWNARLVRIFKPGTYSFLAEGTSKDGMFSGQVVPGEEIYLPYKIYHYSRVDTDPLKISRRVRNLDGFFHPEGELTPEAELLEYDFVPRTHDQFSKEGFPEEVQATFAKFTGTHPKGIAEWYTA